MQPNQSYLTAYLASKRSGANVGLSGSDNSNSNTNFTNNGLNQAMGNSRMSELESSRSYLSRSLPLPPHSLSGTNSISMRRGIDASMTIENSSARLPVLTSDEELNAAHQRTATLLNQYFTRQDQVERSEKLLLEQRISSALGTSALIKPILQQFQQQQQALQLQQQLTSLLSNNTSDDVILELLRQNIPLLSTVQREESASMNQLQQHLQQLQQNDAQNQLRTLPMNNNGSSGAYREFRAINSAQYDSAVLFSNFDALTQARILSGLRDIRQSSANSMVVDQMYQQNMSQLLGGNASLHPFDAARESMPVGNNDRKPCATTSSSANENVKSKVIHRMGRVGKFPLKLHVLLKDLKEQGRTDIAAFLPHGRAFGIFNTTEFAENIMPLHFRMSRYSSFQRQLNLYDFQRITEGPDKGAYHHPMFIEGQPDLLCGMKRNKIKGVAGQQQTKRIGLPATKKVASAMTTAHHEVDHDEHVDDDATDVESDIS